MLQKKENIIFRFLKIVEFLGNKLPHPFILFSLFSLITIFLSFTLFKLNIHINYFDLKLNTNNMISINNLLNYTSLRKLIINTPNIFINFPSLRIVILMMMSIGVVDNIGFFNTFMKKYLLKAPKKFITFIFVFMAVNANIMSDAGSIFAITMGGILFSAIGRNPKLGIITGFAACSGGFTANIFVAGTDALLAGITQQAITNIGYNIHVNPLCNYYFMSFSTIILTIVITFITENIIAKMIESSNSLIEEELEKYTPTKLELKGLHYSFYSFLIFVGILLLLTLPQNSFFRNNSGRFLPTSPLLSSIVMIIFFLFLFIGIGYGIGAKKISSSRDIPKYLQQGLQQAIPLIVTLLPASIFIYLLGESNILKILSFFCADMVRKLNIAPIYLLIFIIFMTSFLNLFLTSGSTKWLVLSQIVVPTFTLLNISPAYAQLAFRIGDSATNIISPVQNLIPIVIGLFIKYKGSEDSDKNIGFGSVFAMTLPYSIGIILTLTFEMIIWYYLDIPIGPGVNFYIKQ